MTRALADAYDECCVLLMRATSSTRVLERVDDEERYGTPAYDAPGRLLWEGRVCAASDCVVQFIPARLRPGQRYCCPTCWHRAYERRVNSRIGRLRRATVLDVVGRRLAVTA